MKEIIKKIIPSKLHRDLFIFWQDYFGGWDAPHWSQYGEDIIVDRLLSCKKKGFFIDVGAFHPRRYSNTFLLYQKRKWSGINIEPNPEHFKFFKKRGRDINLNMGVGETEDKLTYHMFDDPLCNSFSEEYVKNVVSNGLCVTQTHQIRVAPLSDILKNYLKDNQVVDLLSIDVENMDLKVLKTYPWDRQHPTLIIIEDHAFSPMAPHESEIFQYLKQKEYQLVSVCSYSTIYMKRL